MPHCFKEKLMEFGCPGAGWFAACSPTSSPGAVSTARTFLAFSAEAFGCGLIKSERKANKCQLPKVSTGNLISYRVHCLDILYKHLYSIYYSIFFTWPLYLLFIYLFIYLFMAVLGLRFCARAFSSCGKRGPLFIAVRGPLTIAASRCGAQAPDAQAQ